MSYERAKNRYYFLLDIVIIGICFGMILSITSCGRDEIEQNPTPTHQAFNETALSFESIEQMDFAGTGQYYEVIEPGLMIISSEPDIVNLDEWVTGEAISKLHDLDYESSFALIVFQGWKDSGDYNVLIERIMRAGKTINVYAQFHEPKPGEERTLIVTSPYHMIKIQKAGEWRQEFLFQVIVGDEIVASQNYFIP